VKGFQVGIVCDVANIIIVFGVGGFEIFHRFRLVLPSRALVSARATGETCPRA
jgi:hypothetical protein